MSCLKPSGSAPKKKLPGRYKGGRTTGKQIRARKGPVEAAHRELDRQLFERIERER